MSKVSDSVKTGNAESIEESTFPKLLRRNCLVYGDNVAMRKKDFGIWQEYTWKDVYEHTKYFSLGLITLGLERDDRVLIIGNNDPQYFWAEWAIQAAGAIAIGAYVDSLHDELKYYINHSEAKFVIAEDQEQVDKVISIKSECPTLKQVIYWDIKGLWFYDDPDLVGFEHVEELGMEYDREHSSLFDHNIEKTKPDDVCVFCYSSGTTGLPKAAMLSYGNLLASGRGVRAFNPLYPFDDFVTYVSPAWGAQLIDIPSGLEVPLTTDFPEEPETVQEDIRDIGPACLYYTSRQWENLASVIRVKAEDTSWWKRWLFNQALKVGYKVTAYKAKGEVPLLWKVLYKLSDLAVLRAVRDHIGASKVRVCLTGGTSLSSELVTFFHAIGAPLVNMYGSTEIGIMMSLPAEEQLQRPYTIGKPVEGFEVKIENDEICVRGLGILKGYWKNENAYAEKMKDGWFRTGDAGMLDEDGYIIFWDRIEELISLKDASRFSPQFIETNLRASPYIKDAFIVGGPDKDYTAAIVSMDFEMISKWAEARHIPYTTYVDLSQRAPVLELIEKNIEKVNALVPAQISIKKFVNLHKEFDPDEAELTRSRKLKRWVMDEKYGDIIKAIYEGKGSIVVEADITYRDKRKGKISAEVKINEVAGC